VLTTNCLPPQPISSFNGDLNLIGKIISPRRFSTGLVKDITNRAWNPADLVLVSRLDKNLFLFSIKFLADLNTAYLRRRWSLRGAHLILKRWVPGLHWLEMDFSTFSFWIQLHGLHMCWQNADAISRIGSELGLVLTNVVDSVGKPPWRIFIRLSVEIDISKPLKPGAFS
jgi:hypothetical protein